MNLYEGMFLLDNQVVRADWKSAKNLVADLVKKNGGEVSTIRRWDERRLAYAIRGRRRGTYYLTYFKAAPEAITAIRHDFELEERVLRYLVLRVETLPETEVELAKAELVEGYTVPPPPSDDEPLPVEEPVAVVEEAPAEIVEEVPSEAGTEA
ncbi:MAG: 30S ribosomal protein S6 [Planctomycetes bacterium]|nr:30S ribosomal protein S6 [Planctomycetota bacterium]